MEYLHDRDKVAVANDDEVHTLLTPQLGQDLSSSRAAVSRLWWSSSQKIDMWFALLG